MENLGMLIDLLTILMPIFVGVGAYYKIGIMPYILIAGVISFIILIALNKIPQKRLPFYLYSMSLCLMWQATMFGSHVVGSDIHGEFYVSTIVKENGWIPSSDYGTQSSTSVVVGYFVPQLSKLLHLDILWVYKAILPAIFSFVPVILYFAYRKVFNYKIAIYAAIFFMIVPTTTLEIMQIGKSMVAELGLAGLVVLTAYKFKWYWQLLLSIGCVSIAMFCHYTIGIAVVVYLGGLFFVRLIIIPMHFWIFKTRIVSVIVLGVSLFVGVLFGYNYYSVADGGVISNVLSKVTKTYSEILQNQLIGKESDRLEIEKENNKYKDKDFVTQVTQNEEILVSTALGFDFGNSSISGKFFRITQYITQILLVIGALFIILNRKKFNLSSEYIIMVVISFVLLACCLFVRQFSMIINITRFYHIALFFIAPLICIPFIKWKWAIPSVLVVYFIFTSGFIFEVTKTTGIDSIQTPYSVSLSAERTGVVGTYSEDDVKVAKWLNDNKKSDVPIVCDYNSWHLITDYTGLPFMRTQRDAYNPTFDNIPCNSLIFVTTWNNTHQKYIDYIKNKSGVAGLRISNPLPDLPYKVVFRSGDAIVYQNY